MQEQDEQRPDVYVRLYEELGSVRAVARALGVAASSVRKALQRRGVLKKAAVPLLEPSTTAELRGTTTLVRTSEEERKRTGVLLQWLRHDEERERQLESYRQAVAGIASGVECQGGAVPCPTGLREDTLVVLPLGDPHVGMLSWAPETGANWDLGIAERVLVGAVQAAVDLAPPAARCLLVNLGDFFHADDQSNQTRRSGHQLDVDGRWSKVLEVGVRVMVRMVEACRQKFGHVVVDNVIGNHDGHSAVFLQHVLRAWFRADPRVTVLVDPKMRHYHEVWGSSLIVSHHGHTTKGEALPGIVAAEARKLWGQTEATYIYTGHVHHDSLREFPGATVETVNTLAARDAYAAAGGWLSRRELKLDVFDKTHGRVARHMIGLSRIAAEVAA